MCANSTDSVVTSLATTPSAEYLRLWRLANPGKAYEYNKTWRDKHPEKRHDWKAAYRDRTGAFTAGRYMARWEQWEDEAVLARECTDRELAGALDRSVGAIQVRRNALRKKAGKGVR